MSHSMGWQQKDAWNTNSPCVSVLQVNSRQATLSVISLYTFGQRLSGLPCIIVLGNSKSVTDLIQDMAHSKCPSYSSCRQLRTAIIYLIPSYRGCFVTIFGTTDPADHGGGGSCFRSDVLGLHEPFTKYVKYVKLLVAHAPRMPGTFSLPPT